MIFKVRKVEKTDIQIERQTDRQTENMTDRQDQMEKISKDIERSGNRHKYESEAKELKQLKEGRNGGERV